MVRGSPDVSVGLKQRIFAAIPIGYGLTYLFTGAISRLLPTDRTEAVLWASMASFSVYLAIVIYAFAEPKLIRLWCVLVGLGGSIVAVLIWTATR